MKKLKQEKGITLIALVVTIIVLLILAGVTISLVLGQDGIFGKAQLAAENTINSQELEQLKLAALEAKTYNLVDKVDFEEELTNSIHKIYPDAVITPDGESYLVSNMPSGNEYIIDRRGNIQLKEKEEPSEAKKLIDMYIAGESCQDEDCTNSDHLHIGDYVDYKPVVGTSATSYKINNGYEDQTFSVPSKEQEDIKWRVLGVSEDRKKVLLTSELAIKNQGNNPYFMTSNAYAYANGPDELDKLCAIYGTGEGAESARSITATDIDKVLGVVADITNKKVYLKEDPNTNICDGQFFGTMYTLKPGEYTPQGYLNSKQAVTEPTPVIIDGYGYMSNVLKVNEKIKSIIFKGTNMDAGEDRIYSVATPIRGNGSENIFYALQGVGMNAVTSLGTPFFSDGLETGEVGGCLKPVIILKSDVTTNEIKKI